MKEQKYRVLEDIGNFKKGEIVRIIGVEYFGESHVIYSNGFYEEYLTDYQVELIEEVPQKFTIGSKWINKCDIYANDGVGKVKCLARGCFLEVVKYVERFGVVEFNNDVWLNEEEALLLLEPYTEPLKEMTAEQIAKEFGVKVVG